MIWATGPKMKERPRKAGKDWPSLKTLILNGCTLTLKRLRLVSSVACFLGGCCATKAGSGENTEYFWSSEREYNSLDKPTVMSPQTKHPIASVPSFPHGSRASDDGAVCCLVSPWITIKQGLTFPTRSAPHAPTPRHRVNCRVHPACRLGHLHEARVIFTDVIIPRAPRRGRELCLIFETPRREAAPASLQPVTEWVAAVWGERGVNVGGRHWKDPRKAAATQIASGCNNQ